MNFFHIQNFNFLRNPINSERLHMVKYKRSIRQIVKELEKKGLKK